MVVSYRDDILYKACNKLRFYVVRLRRLYNNLLVLRNKNAKCCNIKRCYIKNCIFLLNNFFSYSIVVIFVVVYDSVVNVLINGMLFMLVCIFYFRK